MNTHKTLSEEYKTLVKNFADNVRNCPYMTDEKVKQSKESLDRFVYSLMAKAVN